MLNLLGLLFCSVGLICAGTISIHAFRRSLGTGFMVLCIPCYNFYYAFSQFEHPRKGLIIAGLFGALGLGAALLAIGVQHPALGIPAQG